MPSKSFVFFAAAILVAQFVAQASNTCDNANDGACDVPQYCSPGTDDADCTIKGPPKYCLRIVTDSGDYSDGGLEVSVNLGSGLVQEASGQHPEGSIVLQKCYDFAVTEVQLRGPSSNGWFGSMKYSEDEGRSYMDLVCWPFCSNQDGNGPDGSPMGPNGWTLLSSRIQVDGDANGQEKKKHPNPKEHIYNC